MASLLMLLHQGLADSLPRLAATFFLSQAMEGDPQVIVATVGEV